MSDINSWDLLWAFLMLLAVFAWIIVQAHVHDSKIPSKFINGELNEADEAVMKFRAAHRSPRCATCKHWCPVWYGGKGPQMSVGVCRRYPPYLARRRLSVRVKGDDWCAEHTPSSTKQAA